jgi:hypothetical protein
MSKKHQKTFSICLDEDSDDKSEGFESGNSHFSQTSSKYQQDEPELPKGIQSKIQCSVQLRRRTIAVGGQSLKDTASENDASESTSSQFSRFSLLNNEKSSSATAIDQPSKKKKKKKKTIRTSAKICQCWCSILVSWFFCHFLMSYCFLLQF